MYIHHWCRFEVADVQVPSSAIGHYLWRHPKVYDLSVAKTLMKRWLKWHESNLFPLVATSYSLYLPTISCLSSSGGRNLDTSVAANQPSDFFQKKNISQSSTPMEGLFLSESGNENLTPKGFRENNWVFGIPNGFFVNHDLRWVFGE